jgi:hypothetical protein
VIQLSGGAGVVGGVLLLIFNALHPRQASGELGQTSELLADIVGFGGWTLVHFGILMGGLLLIPLFWAVSRSAHGSALEGWARLGWGTAVAGLTIFLTSLAIDGFALAGAAEAWAAAGGGTESAAFASADALARMGTSLFGLWQVVLLGFAPLLYGMAVRGVAALPRWLSPLAFVGGALGLLGGLIQLIAGFTVFGFLVIFSVASAALTVWAIVAGLRLWLRPVAA